MKKIQVDGWALNTYMKYALAKCQGCKSNECMRSNNDEASCELSIAMHILENTVKHNGIFILIVGKSGSGKTTVADILEKKYGLKSVESCTTRPRRYDGELGHKFCSDKDVPSQDKMVGYTIYNGYQYWATVDDTKNNDIYIIDVPGVEYFKEHYKGQRPYKIIEIYANDSSRRARMIKRGNTPEEADARIAYDKTAFDGLKPDARFENSTLKSCVQKIYQYIQCENDRYFS